MKRTLALFFLTTTVAAAQLAAPPPTAPTPSSLTYGLAVKRGWTEQSTPFCGDRAATNAGAAYPRTASAKFKYVRTFAFTSTSSPTNERTMLDYTSAGFQAPYPWRVGQWISRQYSAETTPRYAYVLEMQERPATYSTGATICMTVFSLR